MVLFTVVQGREVHPTMNLYMGSFCVISMVSSLMKEARPQTTDFKSNRLLHSTLPFIVHGLIANWRLYTMSIKATVLFLEFIFSQFHDWLARYLS